MKKQQLVAAIAALSALCITGCNNEVLEDGAPQAGKQVMMTLQGTTDAPQTRADYTEDSTDQTNMNFSWRSGDALSVVVDNETANNNCQLTTTTEGKSAPFSGTVTTFADTKTIYAFYPYSATSYVVTGGDNKETATATLTLPNPQLYTIGGAISNSFMVGVGSATASGTDITASASLKQVMSIIKLNITNATNRVVTGVKLSCSETVFPTQVTVNLSTAEVTNLGGLKNELSMTVTDDNSAAANKSISFAIFPDDLSGKAIEIEVTFKDGTTKSIKKTGIKFERNVHYTMEFDGTVVNGITWAVGNLVADELGGAKIGTATDGGLYFQFGSLIGWSTEDPLAIVVEPAVFTGSQNWKDAGKIWQGTTGTVPFAVKDSGSDDEMAGIGDPCRYYLGDTWRLPTTDEYKTLFNNTTSRWIDSGGWSWDISSTSATHTDGKKFPASGYRSNYDGSLNVVGTYGYYWSASPSSASYGYSLDFGSSGVFPSNGSTRASGLPVRCVQNASN